MEDPSKPHFSMEASGNSATDGSTQFNGPVVGGNLMYNINHSSGPKTEAEKQQECVNMLYSTDPATDRTKLIAAKGESVVGTCRWILRTKEFKSWLKRSKGTLWITGGPGKGKTFLSLYIARKLPRIVNKRDGRPTPLILQYFCDNNDSHRNSALGIIRGLLYQTLNAHKQLFKYILPAFQRCEARSQNLFSGAHLEELWSIFENMMADETMAGRRAYLVLDGLDECDATSIKLIAMKLNVLSSSAKSTEKCIIRPILVSRELQNALIRNYTTVDLDLDYSEERQKDLEIFIATRVDEIFPKKPWDEDDAWTESLREALLARARGTFLWAGLAMQMLQEQRLEAHDTLAQSDASLESWLPLGLDAMYNRMLLSIPESSRGFASRILRWVSIAMRPLRVTELCAILEENRARIKENLRWLRHLLPTTEDGNIHLVHLSLKEYLLSIPSTTTFTQSPDLAIFGISETKAHLELFKRCMSLMQLMRKNICNLGAPDARAADIRKENETMERLVPLQYSCRHWVDHLQLSVSEPCCMEVFIFFKVHFLHWLECMGILGCVSEALSMMSQLKAMLKDKPGGMTGLLDWVDDAWRFLTRNMSIILETPLQTYSSCLLFAPQCSIIRQQYCFDLSEHFFRELPQVERYWGPALHIYEDHSRLISCVRYSPDGLSLASGSYDGMVRIWNVSTGALESVLQHDGVVTEVVFASDGKYLATVSAIDTHNSGVKLWDVMTGTVELLVTQWDHFDHGKAGRLAFAGPRNHLIISKGLLGLETWDITAVPAYRKVLASDEQDEKILGPYIYGSHKSGSFWFRCLSVSPTDSIFAVGSNEYPDVQIWSVTTWDIQCSGRFDDAPDPFSQRRQFNRVSALAFSFDSNILASAHLNGEILLWNIGTGALGRRTILLEKVIPRIVDPGNGIMALSINSPKSIAFLADNKSLVIASDSNVLKVLNSATETVVGSLYGHSSSVQTVAVSPDGTTLASGSLDSTVRTWDTSLIYTHDTEEQSSQLYHTHGVQWISLSPDGDIAVSSSEDGIVCVWNVGTSQLILSLEHGFEISNVVFSPNGRRMALCTMECRVRIWDTKTWQVEEILCAPQHAEGSHGLGITFSPDGMMLVVRFPSGEISIFRVTEGYQLQLVRTLVSSNMIYGFRSWENLLASSPRARYLAIALDRFDKDYGAETAGIPDMAVIDTGLDEVWNEDFPLERRVVAWLEKIDQKISRDLGTCTGVRFCPSRRTLFATFSNGYIFMWDFLEHQKEAPIIGRVCVKDCMFSIEDLIVLDDGTISDSPEFSVETSGRWVKQNGKKVLRLPPNFAAHRISIRGGVLAVGTKNGHVFFLKFNANVNMCTV